MFYGAIEKIIAACFYGPRSILEVILFFVSSLASGKTKTHLIVVFTH